MLSIQPIHSHIKSIEIVDHQPISSHRSALAEDQRYKDKPVVPWSEDEFYDKLKQQIKDRSARKRPETTAIIAERRRDG
jgi:hypothetical protein